MRIGVDGTCWANGRGYGRYTREIVAAIVSLAPEHEFTCFLDATSAERFNLSGSNLKTVTVPMSEAPSEAASSEGSRALGDVWAMTRSVAASSLDAFFYPSVYSWFPLFPVIPAVVTIHDAIPERFPSLTLPSWRARLFWRLKLRLALFQSKQVLTVSEFAASDISSILGVSRGRLTVATEAPAPVFTPSEPGEVDAAATQYGLPMDAAWFIYVGGFNPHKNVTGIVRAHARLAEELGSSAPHLVLVGTLDGDAFHTDRAEILEAIAESGTSHLVSWAGFVPDHTLRHLYTGAIASLLPSDCEGFGLPAVEAAACGTPCVATTESPLPQALEGGGIFVKPRDDAALLGAMRLLATNPGRRDELARTARIRAGALSWETAGRAVLGAIERAAA